MKRAYDDITSRIAEPPSFFQADGVPRWGPFHPDVSPGIYADETALVEIACQSCDRRFRVMFEHSRSDHPPQPKIVDRIVQRSLFYGDPPNVDCCMSGPSMNSVPIRVVEYWSRSDPKYVVDGRITDWEKYSAWTRNPALEIELPGL